MIAANRQVYSNMYITSLVTEIIRKHFENTNDSGFGGKATYCSYLDLKVSPVSAGSDKVVESGVLVNKCTCTNAQIKRTGKHCF